MKGILRKYLWLVSIIGLLIVCSASESTAQKAESTFKDTLDGAFDLTHYLYNLHGFLPILMPITEPAIGYGGILAGVVFFPKKEIDTTRFQMPDMVAAAGGVTQNKTWLVGALYQGFWKKDHIRYKGIFGYGDIKLKYYGLEEQLPGLSPIKFTMSSYFFLQQAVFRIGESRFLIGGKYQFSKTNITAFEDLDNPVVNPLDFDLISSGIGLVTEYENLDNILSPSKGLRVNLTYDQNMEIIGSDRNFGKLSSFLHYFTPIGKKWIAGFRFESQYATKNTPFYAMPYVSLRGVPALRYQGEITALIETEHTYLIAKRWGIIGFAGLGKTYSPSSDVQSKTTSWNVGTGFRYLIARGLGLKMGVDIAKGPDDWGVYIVFGSSWMK